jgi:hypothetical protein
MTEQPDAWVYKRAAPLRKFDEDDEEDDDEEEDEEPGVEEMGATPISRSWLMRQASMVLS